MALSLLMADGTSIEWTESTWNPTTGCDRVSEGCDNCYALRLAGRLKAMGNPKYQLDGDSRTSGPGFGVSIHPGVLELPRRWVKPRLVFVNSMSDLFHARVPIGYVRDVFDVIRETPQHSYQLLTKRSHRLARVADSLEWPENLWMGVTIESDEHSVRADDLRCVPVATRFLSLEPLLGPLPSLDLLELHWVIVGGESGPGARPLQAEWVKDLRDRCAGADVPFFFKQWGGRTPKAGGRELDGLTHDQMPARAAVTS